jgi:GlpG protein
MSLELYRGGLEEDLRPLSALLWQQRIRHRIAEIAGAQVVILADEHDGDRARALLKRWRSGELRVALRPAPAQPAGSGGLTSTLAAAPVTVLLIALSALGFLAIYLGAPVSFVAALSFHPFELVAGRPVFGDGSGEYWRFVTPVFLHFGWLHITFNSLWCWELGRRIEQALGSVNLAGLFLVTAVLSNGIQDLVSGPVLFGGLSGVVYGFLGFAYVAGRLNPRWQGLAPATPIMLFMVGWLVICLLGVFDVLGFSVANGAHVGGLVTGSVLGAVFAVGLRGRGPSSR